MKKKILILAAMLCVGSAVFADSLYLYDNFNDASIDTEKWTVDVGAYYNGNPITGFVKVTESDGVAQIDMNYGSIYPKWARIIANDTNFVLADASDSLTFTWDMLIAGGNKSYGNGICVGTSSSNFWKAGQLGYNGGAYSYNFFANNNTDTIFDNTDNGSVMYHYESIVTSTSQTLNVYQYNAAWDETPEMYATSGTLMWTSGGVQSTTLPTATELSIRLFVEQPYGEDSGASSPRALASIDNFYTSVPVPEPATMALIGLGFAGLIKKRRQ